MAEVAIVTDTTHYLPRALADDLGLRQVSLYVNWDGRTDREADLPGFDGYYQHLRTAEDLPTASFAGQQDTGTSQQFGNLDNLDSPMANRRAINLDILPELLNRHRGGESLRSLSAWLKVLMLAVLGETAPNGLRPGSG